MQDWLALKQSVAAWSGLDHGALLVLASLLLSVLAAFVWRRALSSLLPWLTVLAVAIGNELASGLVDYKYESWELAASRQDVLLVMIVPTALFLLARFAPGIMSPRRVDRHFIVPMPQSRRQETIDAEFQEVRKADLVG